MLFRRVPLSRRLVSALLACLIAAPAGPELAQAAKAAAPVRMPVLPAARLSAPPRLAPTPAGILAPALLSAPAPGGPGAAMPPQAQAQPARSDEQASAAAARAFEGQEAAAAAVDVSDGGRLGVALSGGGLRAAFFHIGLLAQMANSGMLRHVEVISTVSGGSVIGAMYYLHLKRLLESKTDAEITDQDYVDVVRRIEKDFLSAAQKNIRTRAFSNPIENVRMGLLPKYSRTKYIGKLFDKHFYRPIMEPGRRGPVLMKELKIIPKGASARFHPENDNAARAAKVPMLMINATNLATGRNWRFEATTMGELPQAGERELDMDKNMRLQRPASYDDVEEEITLGLAVAASAAVPDVLTPIEIPELYGRDASIQLVDSSLRDNLGSEGLKLRGVTHFVISDATKPLDDQRQPVGRGKIAKRVSAVLAKTGRDLQLINAVEANDQRVAFVHLLRDVPVEQVPVSGNAQKPIETPAAALQRLLASIRTDLDSFTEIEAKSLMLNAYRLSAPELAKFAAFRKVSPADWSFEDVAPWMAAPTKRYLRHLVIARQNAFKVFHMSRAVAITSALTVAAALWSLWQAHGDWIVDQLTAPRSFTFAGVLLILGVRLLPTPLQAVVGFILRPFISLVTRGLIPALLSPIVMIYLWTLDRLFLDLGKVERLGAPPKNVSPRSE